MSGMVTHTIKPFYDKNSKILILGTMPSPASRKEGFYYAHPQNRFWRVLAEVFGVSVPLTVELKKSFLKQNNIALWDVLSACTIKGAKDTSIKNPRPNNINFVLEKALIKQIYTTGKKAAALYEKLCYPDTGIKAVSLPSTSPANCGRYSFDRLVEEYSVILHK